MHPSGTVALRLEPRRRQHRRLRARSSTPWEAATFNGRRGGTTPRDFTLDSAGAFLYAANQGTGNVVAFAFDATSGALTPVGSPVTAASASFVGVFALP